MTQQTASKNLSAKALPGGKWAVFDTGNGAITEVHDDEKKAKRSILRARRIEAEHGNR